MPFDDSLRLTFLPKERVLQTTSELHREVSYLRETD